MSDFFPFMFAVWLILFSISTVLLFKSFKKKVPLQILVYLVCFLLTGYSAARWLLVFIDINKMDRESAKAHFFDLKNGDTAIMKGTIAFSCYDDSYRRQDSMYKIKEQLDFGALSYGFAFVLMRPIKDHGAIIEDAESIYISPAQFDQFRKYLDYQQQKKDTILYEMEIKVRRTETINKSYRWLLVDTIQISALKKMPRLYDSCE